MTLYRLEELPGGRSPSEPGRPLFGSDRGLLTAVLVVWALLTLWKLGLALAGNVVWEEAHFVVAGTRPDLAYPDIPAGWPLLARLCTDLFGWHPLAVRLPGLALAQLIPLAIWWMSRPLVGPRNALWAALISMLLPPLGVSGTIFYPETGLQLLLALLLGCAVRAFRTDRLVWWAGVGVAGALGLFVHFRFGAVGAAVLLFALLFRDGRRLWARPGFYLAGVIAAAGLVPSILYNMREGWPSAEYHAVNRHVWEFNIQGLLLGLLEQLVLCTPAFFVGLFGGARRAVREWRAGAFSTGFVVVVGLAVFVMFTALTPFYRTRLPHWPFLAYVALIPFLPGALIAFVDRSRFASRAVRAFLVATGPIIAIAGAAGVTAFDLAWAYPERVPVAYRSYLLSEMEDWRRLEPAMRRATVSARDRLGDPQPLLAASGHIPAVRLEFPGALGRRVYSLDEPYDSRTRFDDLRRDLELNRDALVRDHAGRAVVIALLEPTFLYHQPEETAFRAELCRLFSDVRLESAHALPPGRQEVTFYSARVRPAPAAFAPCPFLPPLYLARPQRAERLRAGEPANFYGMAVDPQGIPFVDVLLDGRVVARARMDLDPPGARAPAQLAFDPGWPRVQFDFQLPAAALTPGTHRLSLRGVRGDSVIIEGATRTIYVEE